MSLIQEALKRQQEEFGAGEQKKRPSIALRRPTTPGTETPATPEGAPGATPPDAATAEPQDAAAAPPPPETASLSDATEPAKKKLPTWLAIVIVVVLLGASAAYLSFALRKQQPAPAKPPAPPTQPTPTTTPPPTPPPTTTPPQTVQPATNAVAKPVAPTVRPAPQPTPPPVVETPKPEEEEVVWPSLTVTAVGSSGPGSDNAYAIINNELVSVGDSVEGAKVSSVSVKKDGVFLQFSGQTKFFKVNKSD